MIAVIFEVWPDPARKQDYLDIAAALRPELERIDGFVSIERFESLTEPGKILSLSFWRDEDAIARWRTLDSHRQAQAEGRASAQQHAKQHAKQSGGVFQDYRLRVAGVIRDYSMTERDEAPEDSRIAFPQKNPA